MRILILGLVMVLSSTVFAGSGDGGIVSSGGQLFQDANHPWFLMDVKEVSYCLQMDTSSFSRDRQDVSPLVAEAIDYWKKQFQRTNPFGVKQDYELGQQVFRETECRPETQLRLVFGRGALEKADMDFLKDPGRYIGVTVRNSYQKLQGRGFIYITSDKGPFAYSSQNRIAEAWKQDKLLKYALIHEFGHVFGIAHMGTGIMSESFLDQMLTRDMAQILLQNPLENFIAPSDVLTQCGLDETAKGWWGLMGSAACLQLTRMGRMGEWNVFSVTALERTLIGSIKSFRINMQDYESRPVSFMHLPLAKDQQTFPAEVLKGKTVLTGPSYLQMGGEAVYSPLDDISRPVYLKMTPTSLTVLGVLKDRPLPAFIATSPLDAILKL